MTTYREQIQTVNLSTQANFAAFITAIGVNKYTGRWKGIAEITSDLVIPANIEFDFVNGGRFRILNNARLTIDKGKDWGSNYIFEIDEFIVPIIKNIDIIRPEWFGAVRNDFATDSTEGIQNAINCSSWSNGANIKCLNGVYKITNLYLNYDPTNNIGYLPHGGKDDALPVLLQDFAGQTYSEKYPDFTPDPSGSWIGSQWQGRYNLVGNGSVDRANLKYLYQNQSDLDDWQKGTVLLSNESTGNIIFAGKDGDFAPRPTRKIRLQDISIVALTNDFIYKINGAFGGYGHDRVSILQLGNSGSGVDWTDGYLVDNHEFNVFGPINYNDDTPESNTGIGLRVRNELSGGGVSYYDSTFEGFGLDVQLGANKLIDITFTPGTINTIKFINCYIQNSVDGMFIGQGVKGCQISSHFESYKERGIIITNNADVVNITNSYLAENKIDATTGVCSVQIGDPTQSGGFTENRGLSITNNKFISIKKTAINRDSTATENYPVIIEANSIVAHSGGGDVAINLKSSSDTNTRLPNYRVGPNNISGTFTDEILGDLFIPLYQNEDKYSIGASTIYKRQVIASGTIVDNTISVYTSHARIDSATDIDIYNIEDFNDVEFEEGAMLWITNISIGVITLYERTNTPATVGNMKLFKNITLSENESICLIRNFDHWTAQVGLKPDNGLTDGVLLSTPNPINLSDTSEVLDISGSLSNNIKVTGSTVISAIDPWVNGMEVTIMSSAVAGYSLKHNTATTSDNKLILKSAGTDSIGQYRQVTLKAWDIAGVKKWIEVIK